MRFQHGGPRAHTNLPCVCWAQNTLQLRNVLRHRLRKNCLLAVEQSSATSIPPTSSSFGHPGDKQAVRTGQSFSTFMPRKENHEPEAWGRPGDGHSATAGSAAALTYSVPTVCQNSAGEPFYRREGSVSWGEVCVPSTEPQHP